MSNCDARCVPGGHDMAPASEASTTHSSPRTFVHPGITQSCPAAQLAPHAVVLVVPDEGLVVDVPDEELVVDVLAEELVVDVLAEELVVVALVPVLLLVLPSPVVAPADPPVPDWVLGHPASTAAAAAAAATPPHRTLRVVMRSPSSG